MNYIPFTLGAYFLQTIAVLIDKYLLSSKVPNPLIYIFYISCFSLVALVMLPFTHVPGLFVFALASVSTLFWTAGAYYMYKGLSVGHASRVIPVIGTLIPLMLLTDAIMSHAVTLGQIGAILLLTFGIIFLTINDWRGNISAREIQFVVLSALLFSLSYLFLRQAYLHEQFLTVLVWSRIILLPLGLILISIPATCRIILSGDSSKKSFTLLSKTGIVFLGGQFAGGISQLLLTFSVSLANPALVNSLQGSQYAFLFVCGLFLAKKFPDVFNERVDKGILTAKAIGLLCIAIGLYILAFTHKVAI